MPQHLTQEQLQEQKLLQQQRITQQQLLGVKLLGMSIAELEQKVKAELDDNPALEVDYDDEYAEPMEQRADNVSSAQENNSEDAENEDDAYADNVEKEEREDELYKALEGMESDDEPLSASEYGYSGDAEYEERVFGDTISFIDKLNEQLGELELTDDEHHIMEYLIGSLGDDGLLRKDIDTITDELAIYEYIDTTTEHVEQMLHLLQGFDPAGVGARNLQECLLLQIERLHKTTVAELMKEVVEHHFEDFKSKKWDKIKTELKLSDHLSDKVMAELRHLNPRPGAALGESMGRNTQQITPDFIIYTTDDGRVLFDINNGGIPTLTIADSFEEMMNNFGNADEHSLSRAEKEAYAFAKNNFNRATWFVEALRQRQVNMRKTMTEIIKWQKKFFLDGDEADLRPMILKDIAEKTGLDISTVSRVSNEKYAQTQWGTFPLRHFFTEGYTKEDGEELSTRKIKLALKELVDNEDKRHPLSDEALSAKMKEAGFPVARRTIAKYRDVMNIPKASLRRG